MGNPGIMDILVYRVVRCAVGNPGIMDILVYRMVRWCRG